MWIQWWAVSLASFRTSFWSDHHVLLRLLVKCMMIWVGFNQQLKIILFLNTFLCLSFFFFFFFKWILFVMFWLAQAPGWLAAQSPLWDTSWHKVWPHKVWPLSCLVDLSAALLVCLTPAPSVPRVITICRLHAVRFHQPANIFSFLFLSLSNLPHSTDPLWQILDTLPRQGYSSCKSSATKF